MRTIIRSSKSDSNRSGGLERILVARVPKPVVPVEIDRSLFQYLLIPRVRLGFKDGIACIRSPMQPIFRCQ